MKDFIKKNWKVFIKYIILLVISILGILTYVFFNIKNEKILNVILSLSSSLCIAAVVGIIIDYSNISSNEKRILVMKKINFDHYKWFIPSFQRSLEEITNEYCTLYNIKKIDLSNEVEVEKFCETIINSNFEQANLMFGKLDEHFYQILLIIRGNKHTYRSFVSENRLSSEDYDIIDKFIILHQNYENIGVIFKCNYLIYNLSIAKIIEITDSI